MHLWRALERDKIVLKVIASLMSPTANRRKEMSDMEIGQRLHEIVTRMNIIVYDPRGIGRMIDEMEAFCSGRAEWYADGRGAELKALRTAVSAVRNHLATSQELQDTESHLKHNGKWGKELDDALRPLYNQACESWR